MSEPSPTPRDSAPAVASPKEPGSPSPLAEFPAEPETSFSLRFLIGVGVCFTVVFAIVGVCGRDWPVRQHATFLVLFLGWNGLSAALVYLGLLLRRLVHRRFGRIIYRSGVNAKFPHTRRRGQLYVLAGLCFFSWAAASLYFAYTSGRDSSGAFAPFVGAVPFQFLVVFLFQTSALYQAIARPGAVEIYERGLVASGLGAVPWDRTRSIRWSGLERHTLIVVTNLPGGGGNTGNALVPEADCERVGQILRAAVGARFIEPQADECAAHLGEESAETDADS